MAGRFQSNYPGKGLTKEECTWDFWYQALGDFINSVEGETDRTVLKAVSWDVWEALYLKGYSLEQAAEYVID